MSIEEFANSFSLSMAANGMLHIMYQGQAWFVSMAMIENRKPNSKQAKLIIAKKFINFVTKVTTE